MRQIGLDRSTTGPTAPSMSIPMFKASWRPFAGQSVTDAECRADRPERRAYLRDEVAARLPRALCDRGDSSCMVIIAPNARLAAAGRVIISGARAWRDLPRILLCLAPAAFASGRKANYLVQSDRLGLVVSATWNKAGVLSPVPIESVHGFRTVNPPQRSPSLPAGSAWRGSRGRRAVRNVAA